MYHAAMALRTSPECQGFLCLAPPGNVQRDLAVYRRALFAAGWGSSAFALPELAILGRLDFQPGLRKALASCLAGLEGDFAGASPEAGPRWDNGKGEGLYLPLGQTLETLLQRLKGGLGQAGDLGQGPCGLGSRGIFLALIPDRAAGDPFPIPPAPRLSFHSADLVLLEVSGGSPDLDSLAWAERLRVHRQRPL